MKIRTLAVNGILAALYIAVSFVIQPIAFGNIQFRIPEIFNHFIVFNKKYFFGIVLGVFFANLFFSPLGIYDLTFGVAQSVIALGITIFSMKYISNKWTRMAVNTLVFTVTMVIIAWELQLALDLPFWITWATVAFGEFVVMLVGMPVITMINSRINLEKWLN